MKNKKRAIWHVEIVWNRVNNMVVPHAHFVYISALYELTGEHEFVFLLE